MFVFAKDLKTLKEQANGKWTCKDFFTVVSVQYIGRKICFVAIRNEKTGKIIEFGQPAEQEQIKNEYAGDNHITALRNTIKKKELDEKTILEKMGIGDWKNLTKQQYNDIVSLLRSC